MKHHSFIVSIRRGCSLRLIRLLRSNENTLVDRIVASRMLICFRLMIKLLDLFSNPCTSHYSIIVSVLVSIVFRLLLLIEIPIRSWRSFTLIVIMDALSLSWKGLCIVVRSNHLWASWISLLNLASLNVFLRLIGTNDCSHIHHLLRPDALLTMRCSLNLFLVSRPYSLSRITLPSWLYRLSVIIDVALNA